MDYNKLVMFLFCVFPFLLSAAIIACTVAKRSAQRRAEEAAQAAKARAAREKALAAEAARCEKERQAQAAHAAHLEAAARKKQEQEAKRAERERRAAEAHALKVARAQELAALAERTLEAKKALASLDKPVATPRDPLPQEAPSTVPAAPQKEPDPSITLDQFAHQTAPKPFQGQKVAFTGKLSGMTRAQAIDLVEQAGGRGYSKGMPAGTTLLVVGTLKNGGNSQKLDKADEWIGQVRKITEAQFLDMLTA